jgi:sigma54-dependent transcription regulator
MKNVEVGMFKLPGILFQRGEVTPELELEMIAWAKEEGVGMSMTENLWSFKKEAHREWFILRWSDHLQKPTKEDA